MSIKHNSYTHTLYTCRYWRRHSRPSKVVDAAVDVWLAKSFFRFSFMPVAPLAKYVLFAFIGLNKTQKNKWAIYQECEKAKATRKNIHSYAHTHTSCACYLMLLFVDWLNAMIWKLQAYLCAWLLFESKSGNKYYKYFNPTRCNASDISFPL